MKKTSIKEYRIWLVVLLLCVVATLVSSGDFIRPSNLINILFLGAPIGIAAIGETMVILTAGIDLSVASVWVLSGVIGAMSAQSGLPPVAAALLALIVGLLGGALNGFVVAKLRIPPLIATLGSLSIYEAVSRIITGNMPVMNLPVGYRLIGEWSLGPISVQTILWVIAVVLSVFFIRRTVLGRTIFALGGNRVAARYSGLSVDWGIIAIYCVSGLLAGLAGVLDSAYLNIASPNVDSSLLFDIIAGCVVGGVSLFGGKGNIVNTVAGVLVIVVIQNLLSIVGVSPFIFQGVTGVVIVLAVLINLGFRNIRNEDGVRTKGV